MDGDIGQRLDWLEEKIVTTLWIIIFWTAVFFGCLGGYLAFRSPSPEFPEFPFVVFLVTALTTGFYMQRAAFRGAPKDTKWAGTKWGPPRSTS